MAPPSLSAASERNARDLSAMMEKAVGQVPLLVPLGVVRRRRALRFGRVVGAARALGGCRGRAGGLQEGGASGGGADEPLSMHAPPLWAWGAESALWVSVAEQVTALADQVPEAPEGKNQLVAMAASINNKMGQVSVSPALCPPRVSTRAAREPAPASL